MESWERREPRDRVAASVLVGVLVIAGVLIARGLGDGSGGGDLVVESDVEPPDEAGGEADPRASQERDPVGHWETIPEAPIPGRRDHVAVWTGEAVLVWGGRDPSGWRVDGAMFDPVTRAWERLPDAPHTPYSGTRAVWDGERLVVTRFRDGRHAVYDPAAGAWEDLAAPPRDARWLTAEVLADQTVLAGVRGGDAAMVAHDREQAAWVEMPPPPLDSVHELVSVRGRLAALGPGGDTRSGITVYDPASQAWTAMVSLPQGADWSPVVGADGARGRVILAGRARSGGSPHPVLAWSLDGGDEAWVSLPDLPGDTARTAPELIEAGQSTIAWTMDDPGAAALLSDEVDAWQQLALAPGSVAPGGEAVWSDDELVVWGGPAATGATWSPRPAGRSVELPSLDAPVLEGSWRLLPEPPVDRRRPALAWTGRELIVWGGLAPDGGDASSDGARYDPAENAWQAIDEAPVPGRAAAVSAWLGGEVLFWGGLAADGWHSDGAAFDPAAGTWRRLPTAPELPSGPTVGAVVGDELWVVAGEEPRVAAYDPAGDAWRVLPQPPPGAGPPLGLVATEAGAMLLSERSSWLLGSEEHAWSPAGRHTVAEPAVAADAGEQVIAHGGGELARYDLARRHWAAPAAAQWVRDADGPAVWTGTHLLTWGAAMVGDLASGRAGAAAYDPQDDAWSVLADPPSGIAPDGPGAWLADEAVLWSSEGPPVAFSPQQ